MTSTELGRSLNKDVIVIRNCQLSYNRVAYDFDKRRGLFYNYLSLKHLFYFQLDLNDVLHLSDINILSRLKAESTSPTVPDAPIRSTDVAVDDRFKQESHDY